MYLRQRLLVLSINILLLFTSLCDGRKPKNAVLLSQVKSVTFQKDKKTTHRRVPAVPQLTCVGGSAKGLFEPEVIRCTNAGSSYSSADVEWTCEASLPIEFKLGSTNVVCEGYDNSDDEYVLAGSCGLEYRLALTDAGVEKFGRTRRQDDNTRSSSSISFIFWFIFIAVCGLMIWSAFFRDHGPQVDGQDRRQRPRGGWGGGGGRGDDDDPPPPYTPRPSKPRPMYQSSYDQWRPGFWSGTAAGTAAGYMAGRYAGRDSPRYGSPLSSFWGGDPGVGPSTGPRRQSPGSSSYSSTRHTSTGFGSTSRR